MVKKFPLRGLLEGDFLCGFAAIGRCFFYPLRGFFVDPARAFPRFAVRPGRAYFLCG